MLAAMVRHRDKSPRRSVIFFLGRQDVFRRFVVYGFSIYLMAKDNVRKTCTTCRSVKNFMAAQYGTRTKRSYGFAINQEEEAGAPTARDLASSVSHRLRTALRREHTYVREMCQGTS